MKECDVWFCEDMRERLGSGNSARMVTCRRCPLVPGHRNQMCGNWLWVYGVSRARNCPQRSPMRDSSCMCPSLVSQSSELPAVSQERQPSSANHFLSFFFLSFLFSLCFRLCLAFAKTVVPYMDFPRCALFNCIYNASLCHLSWSVRSNSQSHWAQPLQFPHQGHYENCCSLDHIHR